MFALISGGLIAQLETAPFEVSPDLVWADVTAVSPPPQPGWSAIETAGTWTFAPPTPPVIDARFAAREALDASDITVLRCVERGATVPAEWVTYRAALRAIVVGSSATTPLPARPDFPALT